MRKSLSVMIVSFCVALSFFLAWSSSWVALDIYGNHDYTSRETIQAVIKPYEHQAMFSVPLRLVQTKLQQLPWVYRVDLERQWPDRVVARFESYDIAWRWGKDGLISRRGHAFKVNAIPERYVHLPILNDSFEHLNTTIAWYKNIEKTTKSKGFSIDSLTYQPIIGWSIRFDGDRVLYLGRRHVNQRFHRFLDQVNIMGLDAKSHWQWDGRYANGFALSMS